MGLLSTLGKRFARGANSRGLLGRLRAAGDDFMDEPSPGYARVDIYPERLWNLSNPAGSRTRFAPMGDVSNPTGVIPPELQAQLDAMTPLQRARWMRDFGIAEEATAYERRLLQQADPKDAARFNWALDEDDPVLRMLLLGTVGGGLGGMGLSRS